MSLTKPPQTKESKKYIIIVQNKIVQLDEKIIIESLEKENIKTKREVHLLKREFKKKYPKNKIVVFRRYLGNKWREIDM